MVQGRTGCCGFTWCTRGGGGVVSNVREWHRESFRVCRFKKTQHSPASSSLPPPFTSQTCFQHTSFDIDIIPSRWKSLFCDNMSDFPNVQQYNLYLPKHHEFVTQRTHQYCPWKYFAVMACASQRIGCPCCDKKRHQMQSARNKAALTGSRRQRLQQLPRP